MRSATSALILTLAACAAAAPSLKLTVNGPSSITDVDNLAVTTTVTNTGSESVKLLNDPSTILSPWKTNSFSIKSSAGRPSFTGIKIKYSPELALKSGNDSKFTILAPGESFKLTHDLAGVYNFTRSGAGNYNFTASNIFQYVDANGKLAVVTAETESNIFKLGGSLVSLKNRPSHNRQGIARRAIGYTGCSEARQTQIAAAANSANEYVANAISYLDGISNGTERYTTWFGSFDSSRLSKVRSHYANIGTDATSTTYDCTCTEDNAYAYVFQSEPGYVYLCAAFWGTSNTGTDSRAGTIVHEQSHFTVNGDDENGGTDDHVYGQAGAQALAQSTPDQAIDNADNHEYFAENTPSLL